MASKNEGLVCTPYSSCMSYLSLNSFLSLVRICSYAVHGQTHIFPLRLCLQLAVLELCLTGSLSERVLSVKCRSAFLLNEQSKKRLNSAGFKFFVTSKITDDAQSSLKFANTKTTFEKKK